MIALAWPFVVLVALGVFVWLVTVMRMDNAVSILSGERERALMKEIAIRHEAVDKALHAATLPLAKDIASLRTELQKLTIGRALGRTG